MLDIEEKSVVFDFFLFVLRACFAHVFLCDCSIWSPAFGLKGKLDSTLRVMVADAPKFANKPQQQSAGPARANSDSAAQGKNTHTPTPASLLRGRKWRLPFELKTGRKSHFSHRAQVVLYTLLLSDRYGLPLFSCSCLYLNSCSCYQMPML